MSSAITMRRYCKMPITLHGGRMAPNPNARHTPAKAVARLGPAAKESIMAKIRVLSPVAVVKVQTVAVPSLPQSWSGRTVGFLDNTKSNFDRLVTDLGELLRARYGVAAIVHRKKANASTPASTELIEELAKQCDVVFAGSAD